MVWRFLVNASTRISMVSVSGRALRPRSADSSKMIHRQGAKVAKGRGGRVMGYLLRVIGEEEEDIEPRIDANEHEMRRGR